MRVTVLHNQRTVTARVKVECSIRPDGALRGSQYPVRRAVDMRLRNVVINPFSYIYFLSKTRSLSVHKKGHALLPLTSWFGDPHEVAII